MKKYSKPTIKVVNINEESGICHSSNWYDRQNHGHQHKNHDDNGNHYGEDNGNGWGHYKSDWDD